MVVIEMLNVKDIFYVNFKYYYETDFITISEFFLKIVYNEFEYHRI